MNKNTKVKIIKENLAPSLVSVLPNSIFNNDGRIVKVSDGRYQVKILNEKYWFDSDAVEKA